jgi:DNA-binding response OmpR family regulator
MSDHPKVLYIDDEEDLLDLAASFFEEENFNIDTCSTTKKAMEMIRLNHYDLIISDARMPSGNGIELMQVVKEEGYYKGKIIVVTGDIENIHHETHRGIDLVLFKPIRFEELINSVKNILK